MRFIPLSEPSESIVFKASRNFNLTPRASLEVSPPSLVSQHGRSIFESFIPTSVLLFCLKSGYVTSFISSSQSSNRQSIKICALSLDSRKVEDVGSSSSEGASLVIPWVLLDLESMRSSYDYDSESTSLRLPSN